MAQSDPNDDNKTRKELLEEHPDVLAVYEDRDHEWNTFEFHHLDPNIPSYEYVDLRGKQPVVGSYCEQFIFDHYPVIPKHKEWRDGIDMLLVQDNEMKGSRVLKKDGKKVRRGRFIVWRSAHEKLRDHDGCYKVVVYQCDITEDGEGMLLSILDWERVKPDDLVELADEAGEDGFRWNMNSNKQGDGWHSQLQWDWVLPREVERVFIDW